MRRLIELMDQAGDRAGALRVYDEYARRLATDYELEPGSETQRLIDRIRAREYAGDAARVPDRAGGGVVAGAGAEGSHARERGEVFRYGESAGANGVAVLERLAAPVPTAVSPTSAPSREVRHGAALARRFDAPRCWSGICRALPIDGDTERKSLASAAPGPPTSVAVLYFQDNSKDGKLEYLASAITIALIDELSDVRALSVVSNNGVSPYRFRHVPLTALRGCCTSGQWWAAAWRARGIQCGFACS